MGQKTNIAWMRGKPGQPISGGDTLNSILGCKPVSPGCANCYAVGECWTKQHNPIPKIKKAFSGTVEELANGKRQFTGKINFVPERLHRLLTDFKWNSYFVNSLSDMFYEGLEESIIVEHFDVFSKVYWQEFRILTKRPERMLELDLANKIPWGENVQMGVTVENIDYLRRIVLLGKTKAKHKWISFEPWLTPWPDDPSKHIRQAFPWAFEGVRYERLRDLLTACNIECSIVGGESSARMWDARYCGFDDIHYILDETAAMGGHPCLKQLGTKWALATNTFGLKVNKGEGSSKHGSYTKVWPEEFRKYVTWWPYLKLPEYKNGDQLVLIKNRVNSNAQVSVTQEI